jgi:hypothetical protein
MKRVLRKAIFAVLFGCLVAIAAHSATEAGAAGRFILKSQTRLGEWAGLLRADGGFPRLFPLLAV